MREVTKKKIFFLFPASTVGVSLGVLLAFLGVYSYDYLLLRCTYLEVFFFFFFPSLSVLLIATTRNDTGLSIPSHKAPAVSGNHAHVQRRLPLLDEHLLPGHISGALKCFAAVSLLSSLLSPDRPVFVSIFPAKISSIPQLPSILIDPESSSAITVKMIAKISTLLESLKILGTWDGRMEHPANITITVEVGAILCPVAAFWVLSLAVARW